MTAPGYLQIRPEDNVAVALVPLRAGDRIGGLVLSDDVPAGHKFSLRKIAVSEPVIKYAMPIGEATMDIPVGRHVHVHNIRTRLDDATEWGFSPRIIPSPTVALRDGETNSTFDGYRRSDGRVGIRNEIWILPTVGCVNGVVRRLARAAADLPGGENIRTVGLEHPYGCSQLGDDLRRTAGLLASLARHPNAAGVLIVALGCENNTLESFIPLLGDFDPARIRFLVAQESGDELELGLDILRELIVRAGSCRREECSLENLNVGLKCGGSDAFSGITANPLLGFFSDRLVASGGTTVLTEVPEMFGAEPLLADRCVDRKTFDKFVHSIDGFKRYFTEHGQPVYENPSPGNKAGGISTLEEKSLGCVQKGGTATIVDVLDYGGTLRVHGLNLLDGPGNDIVASTALAAAGCQLILFTTGRGTPLGTVVPTIKISSNAALARKKPNWIDFDAGRLLEGVPFPVLTDEFFRTVLDIVSGNRLAKNEINDYREIALFKDGVTL